MRTYLMSFCLIVESTSLRLKSTAQFVLWISEVSLVERSNKDLDET